MADICLTCIQQLSFPQPEVNALSSRRVDALWKVSRKVDAFYGLVKELSSSSQVLNSSSTASTSSSIISIVAVVVAVLVLLV